MESYLEIIGTLVGFVYLWLEYRASIYLWVVNIIMPAIYLVLFYDAGLYADTAINIYYLVVTLYGIIAWRGVVPEPK
jgi:nicotinamide mononucleotide transporter